MTTLMVKTGQNGYGVKDEIKVVLMPPKGLRDFLGIGGSCRVRTCDRRLKRPPLYRLS